MRYCIVDENDIITNIIMCVDDESAQKLGAVMYYDGAIIGGEYDPYNYKAVASLKQQVTDLTALVNVLTGTE